MENHEKDYGPLEKRATSPNISGSVTSNKRCIANAFNKFFVRAQLLRLKAGKAVGLDNIPARLLKDAADTVIKPITIILNASLQSGRVSDDWKAARVIPLFKKGKAEDMDNYRPISILPVLSKILEGAVHRQLYHHLQQHNILSPYQCGFRKCHSTEFAALSFADAIRRDIDEGQLTGAVFIDLRKAFDTVDHGLLLDKLTTVLVSGPEHVWFTDYLRSRTQVVEFHGVTSNPEDVSIGVLQGSILLNRKRALHSCPESRSCR